MHLSVRVSEGERSLSMQSLCVCVCMSKKCLCCLCVCQKVFVLSVACVFTLHELSIKKKYLYNSD